LQFLFTYREIHKAEVEEDAVDWGNLKTARRTSKAEETQDLDFNLRHVPSAEDAITIETTEVSQSLPVRTLVCQFSSFSFFLYNLCIFEIYDSVKKLCYLNIHLL